MTTSTIKSELEELYQTMVRIRAFDMQIGPLYATGLIRGSAHEYVGEEAIAVGAISTIGRQDFVTSTHRGHGHCLALGMEMRGMMAEIMGRVTGYCRGHGGSMHITSLKHGMLGADGVVGGGLAIAVGAAYAGNLQGRGSVVLSFFGDGASNEGTFHEALNLATVLAAPVVFICENNQWALSTPVKSTMSAETIASRAASYSMPGVQVDGNDVLAVQAAVSQAVARARNGEGPSLIEAVTYRIKMHSVFAAADTRAPEELELWDSRDPIKRFAKHLISEFDCRQDDLDRLTESAEAEVEDAIEFAKSSPQPDPNEALQNVYAPASWLKEGVLA